MIFMERKDAIRKIFLLMLYLTVSFTVGAVPAKPGQRRVLELADGAKVTALLVGDEFCHYWLGEDGTAYKEESGAFIPIDRESMEMKASQRRISSNHNRQARLAPMRGQSAKRVGYTGQKKGLIILVNFKDWSFKPEYDNALFQRIANEKNFTQDDFKGSVYDYFYDQSEGQFQLTFDVVGPYMLSDSVAYYGKNTGVNDDDCGAALMVIEALHLADASVNYADYDWDGNGEVEQIYILYAGKGEADGGSSNTIWPHEWDLYSAQTEYHQGNGPQFLDGVYINTYACSCELSGSGKICGIGTMCHEFSHCLGFPDFYDIDYSGGQGMHTWDIMCSGSYNDNGFVPAGYTSYERWVAGWKTPVELKVTTNVISMKSLQDGGDTYVIYNKGHRDEYFLLENRQKKGWDTYVPASGLLILHVDYDQSAWELNSPNDDPDHQRMTWIPADNECQFDSIRGEKYVSDKGALYDTFPYDTVNSFGPNTTPAARFYNLNSNGTYYMDSSVENITQNADGTISFSFIGPSTKVMRVESDESDTWYDLLGRRLDGKPATSGVYLHNGRKVVII